MAGKRLGGITGKGFMPGQSGNPGGRPKEVGHVRELARQHTEEAIQTLVQIMRTGKPDRARVAAAEVLLDRAWGKPTQPIGEDGKGLVLRIAGLTAEDLAMLEREDLDGGAAAE